jgi:hypothetical protein
MLTYSEDAAHPATARQSPWFRAREAGLTSPHLLNAGEVLCAQPFADKGDAGLRQAEHRLFVRHKIYST